jgi:NAD(P)-dependent dehydrogenase (short-subunit alcohol dehydrogenase family)
MGTGGSRDSPSQGDIRVIRTNSRGMTNRLTSFPAGGTALVFGASGGVGGALVEAIRDGGRFEQVLGFSRSGEPGVDLTDEASIRTALEAVDGELRLVLVATGFLHDDRFKPERSMSALDPEHMAKAFAVNTIGPALVMKHALPRLPREGKSLFAALSARVGSIGDNRLGGWHSYRASKAALNQVLRNGAIELGRRRKQAICAALHPGTVETGLSAPFSRSGLDVRPPATAAQEILAVVDGLGPEASGGFFDHKGVEIPW